MLFLMILVILKQGKKIRGNIGAYKFTIKGIRKFNEERVAEKALTAYSGIPDDPSVKIRYHHPGEEAVLTRDGDDRIRIEFVKPVRAATPGQSAVFYDENGCVIGGGRIL